MSEAFNTAPNKPSSVKSYKSSSPLVKSRKLSSPLVKNHKPSSEHQSFQLYKNMDDRTPKKPKIPNSNKSLSPLSARRLILLR